MPPGLSLNSSGLISGTPTSGGTYTFNVQAVDSVYNFYASKTVTLTITYAPITITTQTALPPGNTGLSYNNAITATGGDGRYNWSLTGGSLPTGINLNSTTGELSGTPSTGGDYSFTITANDGVNPAVPKAFTLKINSPPAIATTSVFAGQYGAAYSQTIVVDGGSGAYSWSMSGAPAGLFIDATSRKISGIPVDVGQFSINLQVADAQNPSATDSKTYTLVVTNSPAQNSQNSNAIGCEASSWVCTNSTTDVISGVVAHDQELFTTKGGMQNISISLYYKSLPAYNGPLGIGWSYNYDIFLTVNPDGSIVMQEGGRKSYYTKNGSSYDSPPGDFSVLTTVSGGYKISYRDGSSYNFNSSGKITSIVDRYSNVLAFDYPSPNVITVTDPAYRTATITYDQTTTPNRISTITDPKGNVYNFSYQGNNLYRVTNPAAEYGAVRGYWEYQYHPSGLLMTKRDPNGYTSRYDYYPDKRMQTATDPNNRTRTIVYPTTTGTLRTSTLTEKDGGQWLYTYDSQTGAIKQKTDPNGKNTVFYYYPNGFIKAKTEPKDGTARVTTFYNYDSYGNLLIETDPVDVSTYSPTIDPETVTDITILASKSPPIKAARHYSYDTTAGHYDRITTVTDERGATVLSTTFDYSTDSYGEVVTATANPGSYGSTIKKNANGSVRQITDANGKITSFSYFPDENYNRIDGVVGMLWEVTSSDSTKISRVGYDKFGNPFRVFAYDNTGISKFSTIYQYDYLNRLQQQIEVPEGLPAAYTNYDYDFGGNLTSVIDAEQHETKYQYNFNRQVTKITDAKLNDTVFKYSGSEQNGVDKLIGVYDAKVTTNTPLESQPHTAYQYDELGRLEYETDPLGKRIHYTYYDNGMAKEKYDATASTPGSLLVTYEYNNRGQVTDKTFTDGTFEHFAYKANGLLETATNQNISYTYDYYDDGRLKSVTDTTNNRQIYYGQYDNLGQRKQVTVLKGAGADERIINYDYDSANRPWHITSAAGTFTYLYDKLGRRDTLTYLNGTAKTDWDFDDLNRLTSVKHLVGTTPTTTFNYEQFDKVGNRKLVTGSRNESYVYDELYRLKTVTPADLVTGRPEAFDYDEVGNRETGPKPADNSYVPNAANQLTTGRRLGYEYDNFGNQTTKSVPGATDKSWVQTWDLQNRLVKVEKTKGTEKRTVTFTYDPFGRRIGKQATFIKDGVSTNQTWSYLYDGDNIAVEYFTENGVTTKTWYTPGPGVDEHLALERGGQFYYYHADGLGSIATITDAANAVVQSYDYDSYGMVTPSTGFRNSYAYTGREWDPEAGLYYYRARYYDPMEGRFISKDPIGFEGGINVYAYTRNNPIRYTDPLGLLDPESLGQAFSDGTMGLVTTSGGIALTAYGGPYGAAVGVPLTLIGVENISAAVVKGFTALITDKKINIPNPSAIYQATYIASNNADIAKSVYNGYVAFLSAMGARYVPPASSLEEYFFSYDLAITAKESLTSYLSSCTKK